ncbi:hypothetical protein EVAR_103448_1 [Eumeta japonica]|uniref:Uncharacterized protein n=1 Tax=Eumeta variegata TaxID=151549 RepID=A0A4C1Z6N6_EUMVA|nr:hypothetical protein EVAR_103448_1 [Eumeta japonica]
MPAAHSVQAQRDTGPPLLAAGVHPVLVPRGAVPPAGRGLRAVPARHAQRPTALHQLRSAIAVESGASAGSAHKGGSEKKAEENKNHLKRTKSRELRAGIMYYSCTCVKRNGLQHDCRLTACGGEPACLVRPDPVCAPSQLARVRGLADPTSLLPHLKAENDRSPKQRAREGGGTSSGTGTGKRFVVCELKGIMPDVKVEAKEKKCCKFTALKLADLTIKNQ